jgi:hypothetical protein
MSTENAGTPIFRVNATQLNGLGHRHGERILQVSL